MKLCYALLHYDPHLVDPDPRVYLAGIRTAHDFPQALAARGHEVDVVHLYPFDADVHKDRVHHHFVAPGPLARWQGRALARRRRLDRSMVTPAWRAVRRVRRLQPDLVHFFGTSLHLNLALLCLRQAKVGGLSTIVSSYTIHNEMWARRPDLAKLLYGPIARDRRDEIPQGRGPWYELPVFNFCNGRLAVNFLRKHIDTAERHADALRRTTELDKALDMVYELARDPALHLSMDFRPGDIQVLHNHNQATRDNPIIPPLWQTFPLKPSVTAALQGAPFTLHTAPFTV